MARHMRNSVAGASSWARRRSGRRMYDTGLTVLGVLLSRAAGQPLEDFFRERLFEPLGMKDTGFSVPADKLDRLSTCYQRHPATGQCV